MLYQDLPQDIKEKSESIENEDKESLQQKQKQIQEQLQAKTDQLAAEAEKLAADTQAKIAEINRKLSELPKKIDKTIEDIKKQLDKFLGKTMPKETDPENIDFDPNKVMEPIKKALNPVISSISPVESVVGKVPVLGDLMGLLTTVSSQSQPSTLTKEEIKKLIPKPPEIPQSVQKSIDGLINDIISFCNQLPMILIDILFQMMAVIPDLFNMIAGVIGVPSIPFPLNLVTEMPSLMPKIKKLVTELPTQVKQLVEGVVRQKYAESMALAIPKPVQVMGTIKENPVGKSIPQPTQSLGKTPKIEKTPSITPPQIKEPKAPDLKPSIIKIGFRYNTNVIDIMNKGLAEKCKQILCSDKTLNGKIISQKPTRIEVEIDTSLHVEKKLLSILEPICNENGVSVEVIFSPSLLNPLYYFCFKKQEKFFGMF